MVVRFLKYKTIEQPALKRDGRETGFFESHNSVSQRVIVGSGFKYCGECACLGMEIT